MGPLGVPRSTLAVRCCERHPAAWAVGRGRATVDGTSGDALRVGWPALAPQRPSPVVGTTASAGPESDDRRKHSMTDQPGDVGRGGTLTEEGQLLYTPTSSTIERCQLTRYMCWLRER